MTIQQIKDSLPYEDSNPTDPNKSWKIDVMRSQAGIDKQLSTVIGDTFAIFWLSQQPHVCSKTKLSVPVSDSLPQIDIIINAQWFKRNGNELIPIERPKEI